MADTQNIPAPPSGTIVDAQQAIETPLSNGTTDVARNEATAAAAGYPVQHVIPPPPSGTIVDAVKQIPPPPSGVAVDSPAKPVAATQSPTAGQPKTLSERVLAAEGKLVPQSAVPALEAVKKYAVDPFEKLASWGHEYGSKAAVGTVANAVEHPLRTLIEPASALSLADDSEEAKEFRKEHPVAAGMAEGAGGTAGSIAADPRNWPFFAKSAAMPILKRLMGAGFATMMTAGAKDALTNLAENWDNMSPEERAKAATESGLSTLMAATAAHGMTEDAVQATKAKFNQALQPAAPKTINGIDVPVRPTNKLARMAEARQPEVAKQFLKDQTAPAVAEGVSKTIQEGAGIEGTHAQTTEDPYGLSSMSDAKAKEYQAPVRRIDELTGNAFSNAQEARAKVAGNFSTEGKSEWKMQNKIMDMLWEAHRSQLESEGMDVDEAKKAWGQKAALDTIEKAMRKTTELSSDEARPFDLKTGKTLGTTIKNLLQHDDAPFQKIFGSKYNEVKPVLEDFARTLSEQSKVAGEGQAPLDMFLKRFSKRIVTDAIGGGIGTAVAGPLGGAAGAGVADLLTNKLGDTVAKWYLGKVLTTPKALEVLNNSMKLGGDPDKTGQQIKTIVHNSDPSWTDNLSQRLAELWHSEAGSMGMPGTVEAAVAKRAKTRTLPTGDELIKKYGESDGDPTHTAFILPDGRGVAQTGTIHDEMLGGKATDIPAPRERFINEQGGIRMRSHGTMGNRQFAISIPKDGITLEQLEHLKKMAPQMGTGSVYVETPNGEHRTVEYGKASSDLEKTIREIAPIKNEQFHAANAEKVLEHIKDSKQFAVLTAENPMNQRATDEENARYNGALLHELRERGYEPTAVQGVNKDVEGKKEHSFFVPDIAAKDAAELGRKYSQEAILTHEGLHNLATDKINPSDNKKVLTGKQATEEPYYSIVNGKAFSVPLDFNKEVPAGQVGTAKGAKQDTDFFSQAKKELPNGTLSQHLMRAQELKTQLNASGESAASVEAQHRLKSQQAQGLRTYDVDSRKAESENGWHPIMATVDRVDQAAKPFHHIVEFDPKTGDTRIIDSGKGAKPLPTNERIQSLVGQAVSETPPLTRPDARLAAKEVGTRLPFGTKSDTSVNPSMTSGLEALNAADKISPTRETAEGNTVLGVKQKLAMALADYKDNGLSSKLDPSKPDAAIEKAVKHFVSNLKWLHDVMPESIRSKAKAWYETAHNMAKQMAERGGITHEQAAAVIAVLSPQNNWDNNVGQANRLIDHFKNDQNHEWTPDMDDAITKIRNSEAISPAFKRMLTDLRGKKLNEITAKTPEALAAKQALWFRVLDEAHGSESTPVYSPDGTVRGSQSFMWSGLDPIVKALSILKDGSLQNINETLGTGHKVRNFYNNIINPRSTRGHTTIDTHAVGAVWLKPFSGENTEVTHNFGSGNRAGIPSPAKHAESGVKGSYPVYEEAYKRAAKDLGMQPRELQSITWEGIRALMGDDKKTPELKRVVSMIWAQHEAGQLNLAEARQEIVKASGGFTKPAWMPDDAWEGNPYGPAENTSFDFGANGEQ